LARSSHGRKTDRSYRRSLGHEKAIAELHRCAGTQFDAVVVEALVRVASRAAAPPPEALVVARAVALASAPEAAAAAA
jgi:HD-GYP domain-containing protein (c-di-GMP phosphodiesterase class II)